MKESYLKKLIGNFESDVKQSFLILLTRISFINGLFTLTDYLLTVFHILCEYMKIVLIVAKKAVNCHVVRSTLIIRFGLKANKYNSKK